MKLSKILLVACATTLATFTTSANAEFRLGAQYGHASSSVDAKGTLTDGSEDDTAGSYDLFGQWRTHNPDGVSWGIQIGFGQNSSEYEDSDSAIINLRDFGVGSPPSTGMLTLNVSAEQNSTFDLLGLVAWNREDVTPYIMAGYASVDVDTEIGVIGTGFQDTTFNATIIAKDDISLTGYKLIAGIEGKFGDGFVWNTAIEYADYGDEDADHAIGALTATEKVELDQTRLLFGIAYSF